MVIGSLGDGSTRHRNVYVEEFVLVKVVVHNAERLGVGGTRGMLVKRVVDVGGGVFVRQYRGHSCLPVWTEEWGSCTISFSPPSSINTSIYQNKAVKPINYLKQLLNDIRRGLTNNTERVNIIV